MTYIPSDKFDYEDRYKFTEVLNHFAPYIRKLQTTEIEQARWIYGTLRAFGYNRRQIGRHYWDTSANIRSKHGQFMYDYFAGAFLSPDTYAHQQTPDFECPDNWLPYIKAGTLHLYLTGLSAPAQAHASDSDKEKFKEDLLDSVNTQKSEEPSIESQLSFYRGLIIFQSLVIVGLILTVNNLRG